MTGRFPEAWGIIRRNPTPWVLYFGAWVGISLATLGLGLLLAVNALRGLLAALREDRPPELGALFRMDHIQRDLVALLVYYVPIFAGGAVGGVGAYLAGVVLAFVPWLAAEDRYEPLDLWKVSLKAIQEDWQEVVVSGLVASVIVGVSICLCGVPLLVTLPLCAVEAALVYESRRERLLAIADAEGVKRLPEAG